MSTFPQTNSLRYDSELKDISSNFFDLNKTCKGKRILATVLNETEVRVLGSLVEKQVTTPEYYPLTLNALTLACNQKNNRNPVTAFTESQVEQALETLREK